MFPDADLLKHPALLGRLVVTTIDGDLDNDGDYDELIGFGGRSIAIWKASTGELIWDSGDELEKVTALDPDFGALFNANFNNTIFQNRSDDKGPEPEGVFLQELPTGERLAFVSMERTGGILVYDLQDPFEPKLLEYVNTRSLDSLGGDLGTEGLLFIPKNESPNGTHLLVACHEVSGTVAVFEVHVDKILTGEYDKDTFLLNTNPIGIYNGFSVYEGGISGLAFHKGTWKMLSDRGPVLPAYNNPLADGNNAAVFPFPAYSPKLWTFQENGSALQITNLQTLRKPDNSSFRGVPPPNGFGGTGEIPWATPTGIVLNNDIWGIDPEGMAIDNEDGIWVCDEYGTAIWHLNKDLIAQKRYTPTPFQSIDLGVNPILAKRQANAGFSGMAYTPNGKVYSILERPLANPDTTTGNQSYIHRILEIDSESGATRMFAYVSQKAGQGSSARAHLGGIAAINNEEFLVMEYLDYGHQVDRKIYTINLNGASEISGDDFNGLTLEQLVDANGLGMHGIQPVQKHLLVDLYELAWNPNLKHPEGIAVVDARTIALINDNQYGIYSPNADGQAMANWEPTVLYKYTLPESQALDYVSPYCTLELGDTLTACINGSLELDLSGFGFMNGNWSDGQQGNVASFSQEGWFSVLAENPVGCKSRDSFYVHFETMLPVYLGVDTSICPGTSITLDAFQEDADVYLWSNGMLSPQIEVELPGTYTVTISSTAGCTGTDQVEVSFLIPPLPTIGMDAAICPGQTVLLGDEAPGWTYSWSCGAESAFILADSAGFYALTVTDAFGCTGMDAVVVTGLPAPDIDLGPDIPVCANEVILLQAGNSSDLISWSDGSAGTELEALAGGSYSVTVTNSMGCSSTDAITLYAVAAPVFDLGPDTLICAGDSLWLGVDIPGGYTWSTGSAASHIRVFTEGWYSLTVLNTFGCEASDSIYVDVEICTSSSEDQINSSWGIYPNPGTGAYQIDWPAGIFQANCVIRNSLGEVIQEKHSLKPGDWLHLEEWPSGMYVVELESKNGLKFQAVLIHQGR
ncbi:MAG: esterase-like activity of phytase family protein [Saprospiraceae bacterium]